MKDRYPQGLVPQGISAELIASRWGFSRAELDEFSAGSHEKAARATKDGLFDNELAPIAGLCTDESSGPERLSRRWPVFGPPFTARRTRRASRNQLGDHARNSSPLSDGSAAVMITCGAAVKGLGLGPLARILTMSVVGRPGVHADRSSRPPRTC